MRTSLALVAWMLVACVERPDLIVICHNSNCAEPQDPDHDDTVDALHDSLALVDDAGIPLIDGIEMDLLVHDGRCLFAHDSSRARTSIEMTEAAAIVAEHLRSGTLRTPRFIVELDLKPTMSLQTTVDCALAVDTILHAAAPGLEVEVMFGSYSPSVLRAVRAQMPTARIALGLGIPQPLLDDNHSFSELDGLALDVAEIHPGWITDGALRALRSMDVEIGAWFLDMTRETLDGIGRIRPTYVLTGQARSVRAWLDG